MTAADLIEMCAKAAIQAGIDACDTYGINAECIQTGERAAEAIRALIPEYGDGVVCEAVPVTHTHDGDSLDMVPLYRAKETK